METAVAVAPEGRSDLSAVNEQERADLLACEEAISRGFQSFVEVGLALVKIRDERLYRQDYYDFDQYCRHRWGISRIHAHRNIEAAKVHAMLPVGNRPAHEAQARPLTRIRTEDGELDQRAITRVWRRAVDSAPTDGAGRKVITARLIEEAAKPVLWRRGISTGPSVRRKRTSQPASGTGESVVELPSSTAPISNDDFAELQSHVEKLAKLMITETLPLSIRLALEDVCDIVLGKTA